MKIDFSNKIEQWNGVGGWFYVRLPKDTYVDLQLIGKSLGRGFGEVKVQASIGESTWDTSVFPDSEDKSYILFLKKEIRQKERLNKDERVVCSIDIKAN